MQDEVRELASSLPVSVNDYNTGAIRYGVRSD